jgi:hypothetical protein
LERGERALATISVRLAVELDALLEFDPDERERFFAATPLGDAIEPVSDLLIQRELRRGIANEPIFQNLARVVTFLPEWWLARVYYLRLDMARALPRLERVRKKAADASGTAEVVDDVLSIILHDVSAVHLMSGNLAAASSFAAMCLSTAREILDRQGMSPQGVRRANMGVGRALVMLQLSAWLQGDDAASAEFHREAMAHFELASDEYGLAKSLYHLAWLESQHDQAADAYRHASEAVRHAQAIGGTPGDLDALWILRDGLVLNAHWWRAQTLAMVVDVTSLARLSGAVDLPADQANLAAIRLQGARRWAFWSPDMPPFSATYWWVPMDDRPAEEIAERTFSVWASRARKLGFVTHLPDILTSWGDWLLSMGNRQSANEKYQEAVSVSRRYGFVPMESVAQRRIRRAA